MTSLHLVADSGLSEDEVSLDPCSLTVRYSNSLAAELVRQALVERLSGIAEVSGRALPVDFFPEIHVHLTLLADSPSIPADRRLDFSKMTLSLEGYLKRLAEMGFKVELTSQLLRGLRMCSSYRTVSSHNYSYITTTEFRQQLGRLDILLSQSIRSSYQPFHVILYLPDIARLDGRRLRTAESIHRLDPSSSVNTGFSFIVSGREHHFFVWNDEHYLTLSRRVTSQLRIWLGLEKDYVDELQKMVPINGTSMKFRVDHTDISLSSCALTAWDAYVLEMVWSRRGAIARELAFSDMERLSAIPGYTSPPSRLLKPSVAVDSGLAASWRDAILLRTWFQRSGSFHSEDFTWEQTFVLIAPFWIPLLAPIVKFLRKRKHKV